MFKTPYDTTACSSYVLKDIVSALQHAMVDGQLRAAQTLKNNTPIEGMYEVPSYVKSVPAFSHPVVFEHFGQKLFVVDTRPFVRDGRDGEMKVTNASEYKFMVLRGLLTKAWVEGSADDFVAMGDLPVQAFIRLVSENIVRRFGLDPMSQQIAAVITGLYYYSLFIPAGDDFGGDQLLKVASKIARVTRIPVQRVLEILEADPDAPLTKINDLASYCQELRRAVNSPRLNNFNPGLLISAVSGVWYGAAAREVVAVAMEYPPTFFAMVYSALTDRSYHGAYFSKLVAEIDRKGGGKEFQANLVSFLEAQ